MKRNIIPYNPKLRERSKNLRRHMTFPEVLLWNELKQKKMMSYDFDSQRPIDEYIVDFYCKDLMLAIEVDGSSHDFEDDYIYDSRRQRKLEALGVRFLRFSNREVKTDMVNVLRAIVRWIGENKEELVGRLEEPTPNPSPREGVAGKEGNLNNYKNRTY